MDNKNSETLRQREKAQRDIIELKKLKSGEIDPETLREPKKELSGAEKRKNFWHYHKYIIIFIVAAVALVSYIVYTATQTPKYDAILTVYSFKYLPDEKTSAAGEWLEKYYPDANGNGKVEIATNNCTLSKDLSTDNLVNQTLLRVQSVLASEENALLFVLDDTALEHLRGASSTVDIFPKENVIPLPDEFYKTVGIEDTKDKHPLYLCLRSVDGTTLEDSAKEDYAHAQSTFEKIKEIK